MSITVSGASDDLIEVEGDITEEFPYIESSTTQGGGDLLAFSDGTVLRIRLSNDGWRITPVFSGTSIPIIEQHTDGEEGTDRATLDAIWVVHGIGMAER